jgi:predicted nucleic acid-binding protein
MIRLELWNGAGARDRKILGDFERHLPELPLNDDVWECAYTLARKARAAGLTAPGSGVLIAACARVHAVELEQADSDFDRLLGIAV